MANARRRNNKQIAAEQLGEKMVITNPNDGGVLFARIEFAQHKELAPNGDIIAYYEGGDPNNKVTHKDELEYQQRVFHADFEFRVEYGIKLIDVVPDWERKFEFLVTSSEVDMQMDGRYAEGADDDEFVNSSSRFDYPRVYSINEIRVNGHC